MHHTQSISHTATPPYREHTPAPGTCTEIDEILALAKQLANRAGELDPTRETSEALWLDAEILLESPDHTELPIPGLLSGWPVLVNHPTRELFVDVDGQLYRANRHFITGILTKSVLRQHYTLADLKWLRDYIERQIDQQHYWSSYPSE